MTLTRVEGKEKKRDFSHFRFRQACNGGADSIEDGRTLAGWNTCFPFLCYFIWLDVLQLFPAEDVCCFGAMCVDLLSSWWGIAVFASEPPPHPPSPAPWPPSKDCRDTGTSGGVDSRLRQSPSVVASRVIIITSVLPLNALHASTRKKEAPHFKTTQPGCLPNPTCVLAHVHFAFDFKLVAEWTKSPFNLFATLNLNLQQAIRTLFVYPL